MSVLSPSLTGLLEEVVHELSLQHAKWGAQNHVDGTGPHFDENLVYWRNRCDEFKNKPYWAPILLEEAFEACAETDEKRIRAELIQTAAVCLQWIAAIDRRQR